jgi:hypothetical protein
VLQRNDFESICVGGRDGFQFQYSLVLRLNIQPALVDAVLDSSGTLDKPDSLVGIHFDWRVEMLEVFRLV